MAGLDSIALTQYNNYGSLRGVSVPTGGVGGSGASNAAQMQQEVNKFQSLIDGIQAGMQEPKNQKGAPETTDDVGTLASSQIAQSGRLNGEYTTSFADAFRNEADKTATVSGAAANAAGAHGYTTDKTVDKTSKLYAQALELESYFVKIMLSSMRNTISKTNLAGENNEYAQKMYEDMLYDELASSMTKNAGFGLADQIYLQLSGA